ncbi:MAG: zinc ribbon domain-containing protein [Candidatus Micrarchaeota archaeon]|nr:zinc ribbon domain-containing protein [Candidatus Micrarchaeota archaeon]
MGIVDLISDAIKPKPHSDLKGKCPKCKADVNMGMERCPKCGTHIESMFRIECPKCKAANKLDAMKCTSCGTALAGEAQQEGKQQYRCPLCGYVADYYMLSCPSCNAKFV